MTWRQSNNHWSGSIAAHPTPKNSECKNPLEKFSPRFFGIKTASSSLSIFQRANYQRGVLLISAGETGHSEGKTPGKLNKGVLFLHNAPAHRAIATEKKLAYLAFQCLDHRPYSADLALSDYHLFPGLKKQLIFCQRRSLLPQRPGWTDNILNCF